MTSHPLAVPIPNQLIVTTCGLYVYDTFNHSLVTPLASFSDSVSAFDVISDFVSPASPQVYFNSGSSLRLLDLLLRAAFLGLEVIASVFLGADFIVQPQTPCNNIATILNENHLLVQFAQ